MMRRTLIGHMDIFDTRSILKTFILLLFMTSCMAPKFFHIKGRTMGTHYNVKFFYKGNKTQEEIKAAIDKTLVEVNRQMSTYLKSSEISYFNQNDRLDVVAVSDDFFYVTKYSLELAKLTQGVYDPTIGPLVNLWGFGPDGKRKVPSEESIKKVKKLVGFEKIELDEKYKTFHKKVKGVYLDLSSSAKGFGVDKVGELLKSYEIKNFMVEIGGELKTFGTKDGKPWVIGIESPNSEGQPKLLKLNNMAVATSGDYRNYFTEKGQRYSHTIDYQSGRPVINKIASVSVASPKGCMQADALSTALMAMGLEKAVKFAQENQVAAFFIYKDGTKGEKGLSTVATDTFKSMFGETQL